MNLYRSLCILGMTLLLSFALDATPVPAPTLPVLSAVTFGWVSMSGIDPTSTAFSYFAPTMQGVTNAGYHYGFEGADGQFDFSGFHVDSNFESALMSLGSGTVRISRFAFQSNVGALVNGAALGIPAGALTKTRGEAYEVAYAQDFGCITLGASVVPEDNADIRLSEGGTSLITGNVQNKFGGRFGTIVHLGKALRVGADYSYQDDRGNVLLNPILVPGVAGWVPQSDDFLVRAGTVGAGWKVFPGTMLAFSYQYLLVKEDESTFRDHTYQQCASVQQNLTKNFTGQVVYISGGLSYCRCSRFTPRFAHLI